MVAYYGNINFHPIAYGPPGPHYAHGYVRGVLGGARRLPGIGGASGEDPQFEFGALGQVLLQPTEVLLAEMATGMVADEPGTPGAAVPQQPAPGQPQPNL